MDEGAAAWSGLGSAMNLPSKMKEELDDLRLALRDLKLEISRDLMELKETISSVIGDLVPLVDRQMSLLTRVEGLEARAQGATTPASSGNDPFNAFAYVSLDELESSNLVSEEFEESEVTEEQPVGSEVSDEISANKDDVEVKELSTEYIAANFVKIIEGHIDDVGGVLNNILYSKLWRYGFDATPAVKKLVKSSLLGDDSIEFHKLSKLRGIYCRTGGDPDEIYQRLYG